MAIINIPDIKRLSGVAGTIYILGNMAMRVNQTTGKVQFTYNLNNLNDSNFQDVSKDSTCNPHTIDHSIPITKCDGTQTFTNEGASGGIVFSLPQASAGYKVAILNVEGQGITIEPTFTHPNTAYIYTGSTQNAALAKDTKGDAIVLFAANSTEWYSFSE